MIRTRSHIDVFPLFPSFHLSVPHFPVTASYQCEKSVVKTPRFLPMGNPNWEPKRMLKKKNYFLAERRRHGDNNARIFCKFFKRLIDASPQLSPLQGPIIWRRAQVKFVFLELLTSFICILLMKSKRGREKKIRRE